MLPSPADRILLNRADARLLRVALTYVLPALAVSYVVLSGLWLMPDTFSGMYGNHDGHWASWMGRGMLEWSRFLDFSPVSPLTGTGSLFLPNLPWLNPGALALGIPATLPERHLMSMLVYLVELSVSLYLLYRHLGFSREHSFLATILYICIFFIPLSTYTWAPPWYALAPVNAHLIAAMNLATIALIRVGNERVVFNLIWAFVFPASLFVAFASAPVTSLTYVPVYAVVWIAFLIPLRADRHAMLWRWGTIAFALLVLGSIGVPLYLSATALNSARGDDAPAILHPGWKLLSPAFWRELLSDFSVCRQHMQLMCPWSMMGWFEIVALGGAALLALGSHGAKRRYGLAIIALLGVLHFVALLSVQKVLGRLHLAGSPFLMWAFFPLAAPATIALGSGIANRLTRGHVAARIWMPAAAGCLIAAVALFVWIRLVLPSQPRQPGEGPLGLPPMAHVPASTGPILEYLVRHIGLKPGGEFRGYASTFLGAPDGLVAKAGAIVGEHATFMTYRSARSIVFDHFGNSFQMMDLWNIGIPTLEEYGQSVSRQLYYFNRDLLAESGDHIDPVSAGIFLYRFRPLLLRALGVRFVIADGALVGPSTEHVMTQTGKGEAKLDLYEIKGANLGQFSPTEVTWAADYSSAVDALRQQTDLENHVVMMGAREQYAGLASVSRSTLTAIVDGYQVSAAAPGRALALLPVQFSHCWKIENAVGLGSPRVVRANIVQTGILFTGKIDLRLRFDFEPWRTSCRLQDADDLRRFGFK